MKAICSQGHVYTWGITDNGRLGHGYRHGHGDDEEEEDEDKEGNELLDATSLHEPRIIEYFQHDGIVAKKVVCGSAHTIVLTNDTCEMYAFGWNMYGQCGIRIDATSTKDSNSRSRRASRSRNGSEHGKRPKDIFVPTKVEYQAADDDFNGVTDIGPVMDVSCGFAHSAAISSSGNLFCWGYNECGQVGIGTEGGIVPSPKQVTFVKGGDVDTRNPDYSYTYCITNVSCGKTHSVAVLSHCSIFEYFERQREIEATKGAIPILRRFVRYSLLRVRLLQIVHDSLNNRKKNDVIAESLSTTKPPTPGTSDCIDDKSIISQRSTYSDWSYDFEEESTEQPDLEENKPVYASRFNEIMNMKEEDVSSTAFSRDYNEQRERLREKKIRIAMETARQREVALMCGEDIMAHQIRKYRNAAKNEILKQRQAARLQERNTRVQQQIQRETERMRNAKKKQEAVARPTRRKITMVRSVPNSERDSGTQRKSYRKSIEMSPHTRNTPLLPSRNKNRKLLIQRRERLQRLERERAEEAIRQQQAREEEHSRQLKMKEHAKKMVLKKIEEVNAMRRKESVKHMLAFVKMKEDINPQQPGNTGTSPHKKKDKFMSLRQWHRELAVD